MKPHIFISLLTIFLCTFAQAGAPEKKPFNFYQSLWTQSPFKTRIASTEVAPPPNPFDDYHLTGIAPVNGGHRVTITHKKNKKKVIIEPGAANQYQVLKVERNPDVSLGTVVTLTDGVNQGFVRFEPKLVTLNTPTATAPAEQLPPGMNPNQPIPQPTNAGQQTVPRPRVVTQPAGNATNQPTTNTPNTTRPPTNQQPRIRR